MKLAHPATRVQAVVAATVSADFAMVTESRNQARERMWREARSRGANAVVATRFDRKETGDVMSEAVAYGTAVTVEPINSGAATIP